MYLNKAITPQQKHGVIVCLPKHDMLQTPTDYRPITLLNHDYKLLARILTRRLRPLLADYLWKTQFCGVPGNTILDAVATVRDAIAQSEMTHTHLCVLSLVFREAFDRVAHRYLFTILKAYGLHECFVDRMRHMYQDATSTVQINGHITGTIPLRCSVRQGCPLSMAHFAMCINPLLHYLVTLLNGIRFGRTGNRVEVVAYADVTLFVTQHEDFRVIRHAVERYEKASGARLNIHKSKALAVGGWKGTVNDLGVDFVPNIKIMGINFSNTMEGTAHNSWSRTTAQLTSPGSASIRTEPEHRAMNKICT